MARPRKPEDEKVFRQTVAFRHDQKEKVKALRKEKRLSKVCQNAVDNESEKGDE